MIPAPVFYSIIVATLGLTFVFYGIKRMKTAPMKIVSDPLTVEYK